MAEEVDLYSSIIYITSMLLSIMIGYFLNHYGFCKTGSCKSVSAFFIAVPFGLVIGLRAYTVGYDTYNYVTQMYDYDIGYNKHEFVFNMIIKISRYLSEGQCYSLFLSICSILTLFILVFTALNYSEKYDLVLMLIAYYSVFGLTMADQVRQLLAGSFFAMSILYYSKRYYFFAIFLTLVTIGIHSSSIIAFVLYLCLYKIFKKESFTKMHIIFERLFINIFFNKKLAVIIVFSMFFTYLLINKNINVESMAFFMPQQYQSYFSKWLEYTKVGLGWLLDIAPVIRCFFTDIYKLDYNDRVIFLYALFIPFFRLMGYISYFMHRIMFYPEVLVFLLYGRIYGQKDANRVWKLIIVMLCIIHYVLVYMYDNRHGAYPYNKF